MTLCTAPTQPHSRPADVPHKGPCVRLAHHGQEKAKQMIQLTRLNNKPIMVNSDLIKFVEQSPDTLVTLISGEKIVVLEKADEVRARITEFRRSVLRGLFPWDPSTSHAFIKQSPEASGREPER